MVALPAAGDSVLSRGDGVPTGERGATAPGGGVAGRSDRAERRADPVRGVTPEPVVDELARGAVAPGVTGPAFAAPAFAAPAFAAPGFAGLGFSFPGAAASGWERGV